MRATILASVLLFIAATLFATEDHLYQGARHFEAGNYKKAIQSYQSALKTNADAAEAYKGIGMAYYKMGDFGIGYNVELISSAVDAFTQSLAIRQDAEACYLLGLSYLALYDKKKAETAHLTLKSLDSSLAEKLSAKISAYVTPPKFSYSNPTAARSDQTSVLIKGNTVLVPVTFSYRGGSAQAMLVLDTGASVTAISEQLAARLGVDPKDTRSMIGTVADGRKVGANWFVADLVAVGPKNLAQVETVILPGSGGAGYDGLLGMNFLRNFRYQVDFSRNVIDWNIK